MPFVFMEATFNISSFTKVTDMYNNQQQMINVTEKKSEKKGGEGSGEEDDY